MELLPTFFCRYDAPAAITRYRELEKIVNRSARPSKDSLRPLFLLVLRYGLSTDTVWENARRSKRGCNTVIHNFFFFQRCCSSNKTEKFNEGRVVNTNPFGQYLHDLFVSVGFYFYFYLFFCFLQFIYIYCYYQLCVVENRSTSTCRRNGSYIKKSYVYICIYVLTTR